MTERPKGLERRKGWIHGGHGPAKDCETMIWPSSNDGQF